MNTASSLPDPGCRALRPHRTKHGMTRSEFYRRAAELYADKLADADLTAQIDDAIDAVGQPGEEAAELRRTGNACLVEVSDEW